MSTEMQTQETSINAVVDGYIAIWNETDPAARRALITETWSEDASYVDPLMTGDGHDGIDAMIAAAQQHFPGHSFRLSSKVESYNDRVRFSWELDGPDGTPVAGGTDFGIVADDGRLCSITGFLDFLPE